MSALWLDADYADTYFETRYQAVELWPASLTDDQKTALLTTAQADIENAGLWTFEDDQGNDLTEDPTDAMKNAVCEQAYFILLDPAMENRRSLIAQGVVSAGIVEETYRGDADEVLISPRVRALLSTYADGTGDAIPWMR
jgi:hypothetical protein